MPKFSQGLRKPTFFSWKHGIQRFFQDFFNCVEGPFLAWYIQKVSYLIFSCNILPIPSLKVKKKNIQYLLAEQMICQFGLHAACVISSVDSPPTQVYYFSLKKNVQVLCNHFGVARFWQIPNIIWYKVLRSSFLIVNRVSSVNYLEPLPSATVILKYIWHRQHSVFFRGASAMFLELQYLLVN